MTRKVKVQKDANAQKAHDSRLRALVVTKSDPDRASEGSMAVIDPWDDTAYDMGTGILAPPYDPVGLMFVYEESGELGPSIEAYETNIVGFGWRLQRMKHTRARDEDELDDNFEAVVRNEYETIHNFLTYVDYDDEQYTEFRKKLIHDEEVTGNSYYEVVRDLGGRVQLFKHLPSYTMRLTRQDPVEQIIVQKQQILRGKRSKIRYRKRLKRFRKFVQSARNRGFRYDTRSSDVEDPELVWFKEYGDPRTMDCRTGEYVDPGTIPRQYEANEVIHKAVNAKRGPYGFPRWLGALVPILGVRASEEINFTTFKNNNMPSMAVMVSGGQLSQGSIDRLQQYIETAIQGDDNYSKFVILEAEGDETPMGGETSVRMQLEPLTGEQHTDAMFQDYDLRSREKARQTFRLAPIYIGRADEYTRATADVSRKLTDEQVFGPKREERDFWMNRFLVQEFDMMYHNFKTNTPNVTNDQDLVRVLSGAEKTGGLSPRVAHMVLEDILGKELALPKGIDLDIPFSLQMAEAVKNQAKPNEVGQQVTALKSELESQIAQVFHSTGDIEEVAKWIDDLAYEAGWDTEELIQILQA